MRHLPYYLILAGSLLATTACQHNDPVTSLRATMVNGDFVLTERQRDKLEKQATAGDAKAAVQVADFYLFVRRDRSAAENWLRLAATNGDIVSQYNLGSLLIEDRDAHAKEEGMMWLHKAAAAGDNSARVKLRRLEQRSDSK